MISSDVIMVVSSDVSQLPRSLKKRSKFGLFSLILLTTLLLGVYQWYSSLQTYLSHHPITSLDHYQFAQIIQLDNKNSFEQAILKYKPYLIFTCGYMQPNIILTICILLTFPMLINSMEIQTSTSLAFFQFNGISIYLQIIRMALDGFQYILTGRCYCLNSGCAAVWLNMLTKLIYYRRSYFAKRPILVIPIVVTFIASAWMFAAKGRVDLVVAVLVAIVEVIFLGGGTIKYPKQVFYQKQGWAQSIKLSKLGFWQPFWWNQYKQNQYMTLDNVQLYITRQNRLDMVQG